MEGNKIKYLIPIILAVLLNCTARKTGESLDFDSDKGKYIKKVKQYTFTLVPLNSEKLAAINYDQDVGEGEYRDSITAQYSDFTCFMFEINIDGFTGDLSEYEEPGKEGNYNAKVNYYLFEMQRSLRLVNDKGIESPCSVYYFERLNELARKNRFMIGFKKPEGSNFVLEYNNPFFSCGKINIGINSYHLAS